MNNNIQRIKTFGTQFFPQYIPGDNSLEELNNIIAKYVSADCFRIGNTQPNSLCLIWDHGDIAVNTFIVYSNTSDNKKAQYFNTFWEALDYFIRENDIATQEVEENICKQCFLYLYNDIKEKDLDNSKKR